MAIESQSDKGPNDPFAGLTCSLDESPGNDDSLRPLYQDPFEGLVCDLTSPEGQRFLKAVLEDGQT